MAHLPTDVLAKYEHAPSFYSVGWSLGKEKLEGKPDFSKVCCGELGLCANDFGVNVLRTVATIGCQGSFYANPLYDRPMDSAEAIAKCKCCVRVVVRCA